MQTTLAAEGGNQPPSERWLMAFEPPLQVFFPRSCPHHAGLCPASWPWARGLCGKHPSSLLGRARGRWVHRSAGSASAFTTEKEMLICEKPLLLCLLPSSTSSLAVNSPPFP